MLSHFGKHLTNTELRQEIKWPAKEFSSSRKLSLSLKLNYEMNEHTKCQLKKPQNAVSVFCCSSKIEKYLSKNEQKNKCIEQKLQSKILLFRCFISDLLIFMFACSVIYLYFIFCAVRSRTIHSVVYALTTCFHWFFSPFFSVFSFKQYFSFVALHAIPVGIFFFSLFFLLLFNKIKWKIQRKTGK